MNKNIFIDKVEENNIIDILRRNKEEYNNSNSAFSKKFIISLPFNAVNLKELYDDYFSNTKDYIDIFGYDQTTSRIVIQIKDITKINI